MSQDDIKLSWVARVTQKQFSSKKNYLVICSFILLGLLLLVFKIHSLYGGSVLDVIIAWRYLLLAILLIPVTFFLLSMFSGPAYFLFCIYEWGITRINCRADGSLNLAMRFALQFSNLKAQLFGGRVETREVMFFKAAKGYREENGIFVIEPKESTLPPIEYAVIPNNNKEAIRALLNRYITS